MSEQLSVMSLAELIRLRAMVPPPPTSNGGSGGAGSLSERFLIPPFSVLDARQGYWQKRKRMWLDLGIRSELGRGSGINNQSEMALRLAGGFENHPAHRSKLANAAPYGSPRPACTLKDGKTQRGDGQGRPLVPGGAGANLCWQDGASGGKRNKARTFGTGGPGDMDEQRREWMRQAQAGASRKTLVAGDRPFDELDEVSQKIIISGPEQGSGTSIFDPVICELAYRWFTPPNGRVLDPFAGGSVRGIVAACLGRGYAGLDLRPEQVAANYDQAETICPNGELQWIAGDALNVRELLPSEYDLVFSCPPYADLERYSDDPRDLSTMSYPQFLDAYTRIIAASCSMLRMDRFACFVVGDVRDRTTGNYRNLVGDTVRAFRAAGLELYNDAVLITVVGSLPIRVGKQFARYRKLGKTHQNVLVFVKGDAERATQACGEVDMDDLDMPDCVPNTVAVCEDGSNVTLLDAPLTEACLQADIIRGNNRQANQPASQVWVGTDEGMWQRIEDNQELTYLAGGRAYLNRGVFPNAPTPGVSPLAAERLRGT